MSPSSQNREAFRQLMEIGGNQAAKALGVLLGDQKVVVDAHEVFTPSDIELAQVWGGPKAWLTAVWFQLESELTGSLLVVFPQKEARHLASVLVRQPVEDSLSLLQLSALQETSNILVSACLTALGNHLQTKLAPSVPFLLDDEAQRVWEEVLSRASEKNPQPLVLQSVFHVEGAEPISVRLFWMPDALSQQRLLAILQR